jgi:hypothetical protein
MKFRCGDRESHPASRAQGQQVTRGHGQGRIAYTDIIRYGRQITVATYGPGTADAPEAAGQFQTLAGIARCGAVRSSYQRRWEWPTLGAARAGHQDIVTWLTAVAAWLAGATDEIPSPGRIAATAWPR